MKKIASKCGLVLSIIFLLYGCQESLVGSKSPVVLTLWHVYGGQTDTAMNKLIDRFNQTVGREKGITVNVTCLTNAGDIHSALIAAVKKHPGAGELPDMFTVYPKTALAIGPERLVDWKDYISEDTRKEFVPSFVSEGEIDGRLVLFPVAKSSSALFINATIFDQFSRETGIRYEDLATWEDMFQAAKRYYQWSGGKAFFKYDDWLQYSMLNTVSLGGEFFKDGKINVEDPVFQKVWSELAASAISGEVCLLGGYAMTAMMTGEAICGIESTASVYYFKDKVTFPDNTTIPLRLRILPVPYFKDGKPLAVQRGAGLGAIKSTREKEQAAAIFAEWLTKPEQNVPFVLEHGYLPVREVAYLEYLKQSNPQFQEGKYQELYNAIKKIHLEYQFYTPQLFDGFNDREKEFIDTQMDLFKKYRRLPEDARRDKDELIKDMLLEMQSGIE